MRRPISCPRRWAASVARTLVPPARPQRSSSRALPSPNQSPWRCSPFVSPWTFAPAPPFHPHESVVLLDRLAVLEAWLERRLAESPVVEYRLVEHHSVESHLVECRSVECRWVEYRWGRIAILQAWRYGLWTRSVVESQGCWSVVESFVSGSFAVPIVAFSPDSRGPQIRLALVSMCTLTE